MATNTKEANEVDQLLCVGTSTAASMALAETSAALAHAVHPHHLQQQQQDQRVAADMIVTSPSDQPQQQQQNFVRNNENQQQQTILTQQQQQKQNEAYLYRRQLMAADPVLASFSHIIASPELFDTQSRYILGESLGSGAFGRVWHVVRRSDGSNFVAKLIELKKMDKNAALRARSEVSCLAACKHFGCVGFIEDFNINGNLLIIMEYCDAGDLYFQLKTMKKHNNSIPVGFTEREIRLILLQILLALNHMHRRKMLHRDIKAGNVLLSTVGLVKIGDFGLSKEYSDSFDGHHNCADTFCGTADYLAPEVWRRERYGSKADVWSLGILVYECIMGYRPFRVENNSNTNNNNPQQPQRPPNESLREKILNEEPNLPTNISPEFRHILAMMLRKNPVERISVRELLDTPFIREHTVPLFCSMLMKPKRFPPEVRDRVLLGIQESYETGPSPITITNCHYEGPIAKLKDGVFVDRYLMLKDGMLGIFKSKRACEGIVLTAQNSVEVKCFVRVQRVPISNGSNLIDNVFVIDFGGDRNGSNCVWIRSEKCDEWVMHIRSAMPRN